MLTGQTCCETGEQLRKWVPDVASIDDCQRAGGDRVARGLFDEVSTGERRGVGGHTHPGRHLGVAGPDARERAGQQGRGLPDVPGDDVDQRLRPCGVGVMFVAESTRPGAIEDLSGLRPVTGDELGPRRLEEPLGRPSRVGGELRGAPQVHGRGGRAATLPRSLGRRLQGACDLLVGAGCRRAEVPRAPIGVGFCIERLGERGVGAAAIGCRGRVVDRRADERMTELDGRRERDQAAGLRLLDRVVPRQVTDGVRGAAQEPRIAQPLGRRQQQHRPSTRVERPYPRCEQAGESLADRQGVRERSRAAKLLDRQRAGQLHERQRVAVRRGDDVVGDDLVDGSHRSYGQQLVGVGSGQPAQLDPADAFEADAVLRCLAHGDERRHAFRAESAPHERQRQRRLVIEPLGVVDEDEDGLCAGCLGEEAQDGEADEEWIGGVVLRLAEYAVECASLGFGQSLDAVEEQQHQLVHCRVPEVHLRFDADDADDTEAGSAVDRVPDQRRLPDAGGAGEQECTGDAAVGVAQECVDRGALGGATDEKVAPMCAVSGIGHARHETPAAAGSNHTITADRPVLPNVSSPVAADEPRDVGAGGGSGQAP